MYLFSFLIYPAAIYLLLDKPEPKRLFSLMTGIVLSSILSVVFWSLSTFYNPASLSFLYNFINIMLREYMVFILISLFICTNIYTGSKTFGDYFLVGVLVGITIFSVALNFSSNNAFIIFIQPLFFVLFLYLFFNKNVYRFKKYDQICKISIFIICPFLVILTRSFFKNNFILFLMFTVSTAAVAILIFIYRKVLLVKND